MNRHVFLLGNKLNMIRIHAVLIEAAVMVLPPPGAIWRGVDRNRSIHFGPSNLVGVFRLATTSSSDCRVEARAGATSVPLPAIGYGVDGVFAFQARGSTYSSSFRSHGLLSLSGLAAQRRSRIKGLLEPGGQQWLWSRTQPSKPVVGTDGLNAARRDHSSAQVGSCC